MKFCKYCQRSKPETEFTVRKASPDGLSYKCRDCGLAYAKNRYATNVEAKNRAIAYAAEWTKNNKEKRKAIVKKSYEKDIEKNRRLKRESAKARAIADPNSARMRWRMAAQVRRHRAVSANSFIHPGLARRLLDVANSVCAYCGNNAALTIDHFDPVSKGGGGAASNLVACCQSCNSSKRDGDGLMWLEKRFGIDGLIRAHFAIIKQSAARLP